MTIHYLQLQPVRTLLIIQVLLLHMLLNARPYDMRGDALGIEYFITRVDICQYSFCCQMLRRCLRRTGRGRPSPSRPDLDDSRRLFFVCLVFPWFSKRSLYISLVYGAARASARRETKKRRGRRGPPWRPLRAALGPARRARPSPLIT